MNDQTHRTQETPADARSENFAQLAEQKTPGTLREFLDFMHHTKKWWLAPVILSLLLVGTIVILGGTSIAPLIYTLF